MPKSSDKSIAKAVAAPAAQSTGRQAADSANPHADGTTRSVWQALEQQFPQGQTRRSATGWGVSAAAHVVLFVVMSLIVLQTRSDDEEPPVMISTKLPSKDVVFEPIKSDLDVTEEWSPPSTDVRIQPIIADTPMPAPEFPDISVPVFIEPAAPQKIAPEKHSTKSSLAGRNEIARAQLVAKFGGSAASEAAVALGLQWLAEHQNADGSWSFDHRNSLCGQSCTEPGQLSKCKTGATGMALLAFLGAGHTHLDGRYADRVKRGVDFLLESMRQTELGPGDLRGNVVVRNEGLYAHGIATMALCEAYAMTGDSEKFRVPLQHAVNAIVKAQDPRGGGWRYRPQQPGDTSVIGWQLMAIKSARTARLKVPQQTIQMAAVFLNSVQSRGGALYGYLNSNPKASTTAIGLLCRMYMGWNRRTPALANGVDFLSLTGPAANDMYYNYYATQVLFHWGGDEWTRWNDVMRRKLVDSQEHEGHAAGSWAPRDAHSGGGGRLYMTCLCINTLEVYYRYLPLYQTVDLEGDLALEQ